MLHRSLRCVTQPRDFRGVYGARGVLHGTQSSIEFQWLGAHHHGGAEPAELPKEQSNVAGEGAIVSGMAGRYATALFELAREQNAIDTVKVNLDRFDALVAEIADLARLLRSPVLSTGEQTRALSAVLDKTGIDGIAANFLKLVAAKRRLFAARDMVKAYRALVARHKGEVTAEVTLAQKPSEAHLAAIKDVLTAMTRKEVQMDVKVDPAIIGGLVVKLGSRMVDTSLRTKLNAIRLAMKEAR
jgi:F-type H+-transporting ATPase subunit delta